MDLRMPGMDGIEATRQIRTEGGRAAVVILTGEGDDVDMARAIQAGARGMLAKTSAFGDVAAAVRRAHQAASRCTAPPRSTGCSASSAPGRSATATSSAASSGSPRASSRCLQLMADGRSTEEIAEQLGISRHTLRTHTQNILTRLGVHSKTDAVVAAIRFRQSHPSRPCHVGS